MVLDRKLKATVSHSRPGEKNQIRVDDQPEDRQDARFEHACELAGERRRGDRILDGLLRLLTSAYGPKRTSLVALHMSAFGG